MCVMCLEFQLFWHGSLVVGSHAPNVISCEAYEKSRYFLNDFSSSILSLSFISMNFWLHVCRCIGPLTRADLELSKGGSFLL